MVIDSSAVIAVLRNEPGADQVWPHLDGSLISSVNLAEVLCVAQLRGMTEETNLKAIHQMKLQVVPFDTTQAQCVADLFVPTSGSSVGFADRACLALARTHNIPALTSDRDWLKHDTGVTVRLFRHHEAGHE